MEVVVLLFSLTIVIAWLTLGRTGPKTIPPKAISEPPPWPLARYRVLRREWQVAARRLGLAYQHDWQITGECRGLLVTIVGKVWKRRHGSTRIRIDGRGRIPKGLRLRARGSAEVDTSGIATGDPEFDAMVRITGKEAEALAVLTLRARRRIDRILYGTPGKARVANGRVTCRQASLLIEREPLVAVVTQMLTIAELVSVPKADVKRRLRANAAKERDARVRWHNLDVLLRRFPRSKHALRAARTALSDQDARVRLRGAIALGEAGLVVLLELARSNPDPGLREQALGALASFAGDRMWPSIESALEDPEPDVRRAAMVAAVATHCVGVIPRLATLAETADQGTLEAIASMLGQLGSGEAEPSLIRLLEHEAVAVQRQAAGSLAMVGTAAALEPLLRHANGMFTDGELKHAARNAIASIRSRLGPVEAGGLSLAEQGRAGGLSLAEPGGATSTK